MCARWIHDRLLHGALAQAPPLLLLVAGPLTAQAGTVRTYGYLALRNADAHVYIKDSAGHSTVRVGLWSHASVGGRYYGAGYALTPERVTTLYAPALRQLAVALDSGAVIDDTFHLPSATVRLQCRQVLCWATFWNVGLPDSLITTPPVPARYLARFATALEAAVRRDTTVPALRDSLP